MFRFLISVIEGFFGLFAPRRPFTAHACERMRERRISEADIDLVIAHGKREVSKVAVRYSIGKIEARLHGEKLKAMPWCCGGLCEGQRCGDNRISKRVG